MNINHSVLFYDGVCHLCNGLIQFIIRHERNKNLKFSSLQSNFAKSQLQKKYTTDLNTVVFYDAKKQVFLVKSRAVIAVFKVMGGIWSFNAFLLQLFPLFIANKVYDFVASHRYQWFGQSNVCIRLNLDDRVLED